MGMSRPSMDAVQRPLIIGVLAGVLFGCILGTVFGTYYAWNVNPAVYVGGAQPNELTTNYQDHYIATVVDSYIVNRNVEAAKERLKAFSPEAQIRTLGQRSAEFVANGQGPEAEGTNELAIALKGANGWSDETIQNVIGQLSTQYQGDSARSQAINTFSAGLLGAVPQPVDSGGEPATEPPAAEPTAEQPAAPEGEGGFTWTQWIVCCLGLIVLGIAIWLFGRWRFARLRKQRTTPQVEWKGEGPAPLKVWTGTYEHKSAHNNYDEFFTIETGDGDFLGESGVGIMKAVPGTDPKQVMAFDVGLFDKTDITTLSRVVMSEDAYNNDQELMTNIQNNPLAEAILAQPGKEFTLETSALRVAAKIEEVEYGEGGKTYFNKLKMTLNVFLQEGADLRIGSMDVPDQFQG